MRHYHKLIYSQKTRNAEKKVIKLLQANKAYVSIYEVGIDLEKIPAFDQFVLQFGEQNLTVRKERIEDRGANNFYLAGKNRDGAILSMSVIDGDVQGIIETSSGVYSIKSLGKDEYVIVKVDQSKMIEACDDIPDDDILKRTGCRELTVWNHQKTAMLLQMLLHSCQEQQVNVE